MQAIRVVGWALVAIIGLAPGNIAGAQPCSAVEAAQFFGPKSDWYGHDVAIDGDIAIVGAPDTDFEDVGAAYVYRRTEGVWALETQLVPSNGEYLDYFGYEVAIADGRLVVAKSGWDKPSAGGVYVFSPSDAGWVQEAEIQCPEEELWFGTPMAASGDAIIVAADEAGAAYIFRRGDDAQWHQESRLIPPPDGNWLEISEVTLSGDFAAFGLANYYQHSGVRAFVYARDPGGVWTEDAEIIPPTDEAGPCYWAGVQLSGPTLIVTASYGEPGGPNTWRAFAYRRSIHGTWNLEAELPSGPLALSGDIALIAYDGAVHMLLRHPVGVWEDVHSFVAHDTIPGDAFGSRMDLQGATAIIAAQFHEPESAAYLFDLESCEPCPADLNGDGAADLFDFLAFANLFNAGEAAADCDDSGDLDLFDFLCFGNVFQEGC